MRKSAWAVCSELNPGGGSRNRLKAVPFFACPGGCGYAVLEGRRIIVDPADGADPRNVRLYLLGSAMGLLLHQRGVLPLHANAVEIDGQAFAFMGPSGAGKSTLAAWFHDQGLRVVADDVCAVHFDAQLRPWVSQGLPRLRLWKSALEATGRSDGHFQRSYAGDEQWDKFDVPLVQPDEAQRPVAAGRYLSPARSRRSSRSRVSRDCSGGCHFRQHLSGPVYRRRRTGAKPLGVSLKLIAGVPIFSRFEALGICGRSMSKRARSSIMPSASRNN